MKRKLLILILFIMSLINVGCDGKKQINKSKDRENYEALQNNLSKALELEKQNKYSEALHQYEKVLVNLKSLKESNSKKYLSQVENLWVGDSFKKDMWKVKLLFQKDKSGNFPEVARHIEKLKEEQTKQTKISVTKSDEKTVSKKEEDKKNEKKQEVSARDTNERTAQNQQEKNVPPPTYRKMYVPIQNGKVPLSYVQEQISRIEKLPKRLFPCVLVLPLCNQSKQTSELGTFLSILGMFRATFVPYKLISIPFPRIEDDFHCAGFAQPGSSIQELWKNRMKAYYNPCAVASGLMEIHDSHYSITLKFEGQKGEKSYQKEFTEVDLINTPTWIASCIHEYLNIQLTQEENAFFKNIEFKHEKDIIDAAKFYCLCLQNHWHRSPEEWQRLCSRNPDSVFLAGCYFRSLWTLEYPKPTQVLTKLSNRYPIHDYLSILKADYFMESNSGLVLALLFEMLPRDYINPSVYNRLEEALTLLQQPEGVEILYESWYKNDPSSYLASLNIGRFYIDYAWLARGTGFANTVSREDWKKYDVRLQKAEYYLKKAFNLNPRDGRSAHFLITVCMGLNYPRDVMEQWFELSISADPEDICPYSKKLTYLMPKWHGSMEEMFDFARRCAEKGPPGTKIPMVLVYVHAELAAFYNMGPKHYQNPEVWADIQSIYTTYLKYNPEDMDERNNYADYATKAGKYDIAVEQIEYIQSRNNQTFLEYKSFSKTKENAELFFRLAGHSIKQNDTKKAIKWLGSGLSLDPERFDYQMVYAGLLIKEKRFRDAYEHFQYVADHSPSSQLKNEAMSRLKELDGNPLSPDSKSISFDGFILYLVRMGDVDNNIMESLMDDISRTFGMNVQILRDPFIPPQEALLPKRSTKIKETVDSIIDSVGEANVKKLATKLGIEPKSLSTKEGRENFLKAYLLQNPETKKVWDDIDVMGDQWDSSTVYNHIKASYEYLIDQEDSIGVLVVTNEDIGGHSCNFYFGYANNGAGIMSYYRFVAPHVSPERLLRRTIKNAYISVGKLVRVYSCSVPYCVRSFSNNVAGYDAKNMEMCEECIEKLKRVYKCLKALQSEANINEASHK